MPGRPATLLGYEVAVCAEAPSPTSTSSALTMMSLMSLSLHTNAFRADQAAIDKCLDQLREGFPEEL